jgi:hypothetical protein
MTAPQDADGDYPGRLVPVTCDCGHEVLGIVTGSECQLLDWFCPHCKEHLNDVNA